MGSKKKAANQAYTVILSRRAELQKDNIEVHIAFIQMQTSNAVKVSKAFDKVFDRIERNPFACKACEEFPTSDNSIRKATCLSWYIIYKIAGSKVLVVAIIHHSQPITSIGYIIN